MESKLTLEESNTKIKNLREECKRKKETIKHLKEELTKATLVINEIATSEFTTFMSISEVMYDTPAPLFGEFKKVNDKLDALANSKDDLNYRMILRGALRDEIDRNEKLASEIRYLNEQIENSLPTVVWNLLNEVASLKHVLFYAEAERNDGEIRLIGTRQALATEMSRNDVLLLENNRLKGEAAKNGL